MSPPARVRRMEQIFFENQVAVHGPAFHRRDFYNRSVLGRRRVPKSFSIPCLWIRENKSTHPPLPSSPMNPDPLSGLNPIQVIFYHTFLTNNLYSWYHFKFCLICVLKCGIL